MREMNISELDEVAGGINGLSVAVGAIEGACIGAAAGPGGALLGAAVGAGAAFITSAILGR